MKLAESSWAMEFNSTLTEAILLKRHKRFLVDIAVSKTDRRTIYCPNTGSMAGCEILGSRIWFSSSTNPRRKYPYTWELVEVDGGHLVLVNTQRASGLVKEAVQEGIIEELNGYPQLECECECVTSTSHKRFDFKLSGHTNQEDCYVEVSPVTLGDEINRGFFPDSLNFKAARQVRELIEIKQQGARAVLMCPVLHTGIVRVFPADHIDPDFGKALRDAVNIGVEIIAYGAQINLSSIKLINNVEVCVPQKTYGSRIHI